MSTTENAVDPESVIRSAEKEKSEVYGMVNDAATYFLKKQGNLFPREEAHEKIEEHLGVSTRMAGKILASLVGDDVDPIIQVENGEGRFIGVVEYKTGDGWYGYIDYDDMLGDRKCVICAQCVKENRTDDSITKAVEGEGSFKGRNTYSYGELEEAIHLHYENAHDGVRPRDVEVGASLISGTTIGGNTSWHAGNDGSGSGLAPDPTTIQEGGTVAVNVEDLASGLTDGNAFVANSTGGVDGVSGDITVNSGTGMTGGATISLGGSTTLNVGFGDDEGLDFGASDDFTFQFDSTNTQIELVNNGTTNVVFSVDTADDVLDVHSDINFSGITGTPTFSGHDHTSGGMSTIPNSGLANSSVTVTAGNALTGGGSISLGGSASIDVETDGIQTSELDLSITPTWTGTHTFNGGATMGADVDYQSTHLPINLPSPSNNGDAARKSYVDSVAQGLNVKDSVRAGAESNIDLTSSTDPNPVDGVTLSNGDRVLLKSQTDATENGIYDANTATDPTTWTRSSDSDEDSEVTAGDIVFVEEGTANGDISYVITTDDPITLGTTSISWSVFAKAGEITAGTGLTKSGDTISISSNGVTTTELDLSITPTWTGAHTFDAGISLNDGDGITLGTGSDYTLEYNAGGTELRLQSADVDGNGTTGDVLQIQDGTQDVEFLSDISFPNITGTPTFGGHDHSEGGMSSIPNSGLANSSITVSGGTGIKNGGSVSLGGSVTLNIEPNDFAGNGLEDDGSDNLAISSNAIQLDELDQSISPTWTARHDFNGNLGLNDGGKAFMGTNDDFSQRYDATADDVRWRDETNATDRMGLDRTTGDLTISGEFTEGATL